MDPEDLGDRAATCLIKMSRVGIEGQAFLDPGSRIQLNPTTAEVEQERRAEMLGMAWRGGSSTAR